MSQAAGILALAGILGYIISHEVRSATEYRSTALKALLGLVVSAGMVVGGLYWAFQIQLG